MSIIERLTPERLNEIASRSGKEPTIGECYAMAFEISERRGIVKDAENSAVHSDALLILGQEIYDAYRVSITGKPHWHELDADHRERFYRVARLMRAELQLQRDTFERRSAAVEASARRQLQSLERRCFLMYDVVIAAKALVSEITGVDGKRKVLDLRPLGKLVADLEREERREEVKRALYAVLSSRDPTLPGPEDEGFWSTFMEGLVNAAYEASK